MNAFLLFAQDNQRLGRGFYLAVLIRLVVVLTFTLPAYLLPAFIALKRRHQNAAAIVVLDLLLVCTFLGWAAAFAWSLTHQDAAFRIALDLLLVCTFLGWAAAFAWSLTVVEMRDPRISVEPGGEVPPSKLVNKSAIASLAIGLLSLTLTFIILIISLKEIIPEFGYIDIQLVYFYVVGTILVLSAIHGHLACAQIKHSDGIQSGKLLAVTGLVLAYLQLASTALVLLTIVKQNIINLTLL